MSDHSKKLKGEGVDRSDFLSDGNVSECLHPRPRAPAPARDGAATQDSCATGDETQESCAWRLEPHICRVCFSRLVSQPAAGGRRYQCTNCGQEAVGHDASVLCCCGLKIRRATHQHTSGHRLVDAGVRCALNPDPRPDFPSLFVAAEVPDAART